MYNSVKCLRFLRLGTNKRMLFSPVTFNCFQIFRSSSGMTEKKVSAEKKASHEVSFTTFLEKRKNQARRSLIVRLSNFSGYKKLIKLASSFGEINSVMHYDVNKISYLLFEMGSEEDVKNFVTCALGITLHRNSFNNFLCFDTNLSYENLTENSSNLCNEFQVSLNVPLSANLKDITRIKANDRSKTLREISKRLEISDIELRLKFLTCLQIEVILAGLIPNLRVFPFGSSVSGFGMTGCDLDLVVGPDNVPLDNPFCDNGNNFEGIPRLKVQNHLSLISQILRDFGKGCANIVFIKNAKVPIIKYKQTFTDVDCDFSIYNYHVVFMSQILFIASSYDECVKPLVLIVRLWALRTGLAQKGPSSTITNYALTLLVLYFLQQKDISVLPPLQIFVPNVLQLSNQSFIEINTRAEASKQRAVKNHKPLKELLFLFFQFYSKFDFIENGISLRTGEITENTEQAPILIEYPLPPFPNVTRNVSLSEVCAFKSTCRISINNLTKNQNYFSIFDLKCDRQNVRLNDVLKL